MVASHGMVRIMGRYYGKICDKHPEEGGARFESNYKCVKCHYERISALKKTDKQRKRMREYSRNREKSLTPSQLEKRRDRAKRWYKNNTHWFRVRNSMRRVIYKTKLVKSFLPDLKDFYKNRPKGFHVDHIVPLVGLDRETREHVVCGLHVPWNLQYLPARENQQKWAYFDA